jgi:hypothetical protein
MATRGAHALEQEPDEPASPWSVAAIGEPDTLEDVDVDDQVDDQSFVVHAPRPVGEPAPRATWTPPAVAAFAWISAHGGAGSTSLARSTGQGADLTGRWPSPAHGWPSKVAVVCRGNAAGRAAAARQLAESASGMVPDVEVIALVVVADAPAKVSRAFKTRLHEISGTVREVVQVPWIGAWRDTPYTQDRAASAAAAKVAALTNKENR